MFACFFNLRLNSWLELKLNNEMITSGSAGSNSQFGALICGMFEREVLVFAQRKRGNNHTLNALASIKGL